MIVSLSIQPSSISFGAPAVTFHAGVATNEKFFDYFTVGEDSLVIVTVTSRSAPNEPRRNALSERLHPDACGYFFVRHEHILQHLGVELDDHEFECLRIAMCTSMQSPNSQRWELSFAFDPVTDLVGGDGWKLIDQPKISLGEAN